MPAARVASDRAVLPTVTANKQSGAPTSMATAMTQT